MNTPESFDFTPEMIEIPEIFRSSLDKKPFEKCISCETYLLDEGVTYFIEKSVRNYKDHGVTDTVFEYAMCIDCMERMRQAVSTESLQRMEEYFLSQVNPLERQLLMLNNEETLNIEPWIENCIVKGTPKTELDEYQLHCQCFGKQMVFTYMPYMIGGEAMEEMAELLSAKSRGEIDNFMDDNFGLPPELKKELGDFKYVLI
ncbi:hypothetical protein [uncultured Microscilla sp.]|uniref:hypothetical protein n=1 Tax=uncultured Microscilla sp. TaxID=432653 RepID=UPI0026181A84|nr:hypothetical protein [uncultured Microscilla sp.]